MKVLVIAPFHDIPTSLSTGAVIKFVQWLREKKVEHTTLLGLGATRWVIESIGSKYDLICYFGHGMEDRLVGQHFLSAMVGGSKGLIDLGNYKKIKPKMIFTMACDSGIQLGPAIGENMNIGYFGHKTSYYGAFNEMNHNYLSDWQNYITIVPKLLIQKEAPLTALAKQQRAISKLIIEYNNEKYTNYEWHAHTAEQNRDFAAFFGPNEPLK